MTQQAHNRVWERTRSSGTGALTLDGPRPGFRTFLSAFGDTATAWYLIEHLNQPSEWEVGIGTTDGADLERTTLLDSSRRGLVSGATNATPIVLTISGHGLSNGAKVRVKDVLGNTAANGYHTVANVTTNTVELSGVAGNGAYVSGGEWCSHVAFSAGLKNVKCPLPAEKFNALLLGDGTDILTGDLDFGGHDVVNAGAIELQDTDASHVVILVIGSNITADRTLTITTGDANRSLTLAGDATISGTNSGDSASIPIGYLDTDTTLAANSDVKVPSQKAAKAYIDGIVAAANALVYKGPIDCSANPNYPAADAGWMYLVSVAGKIGGASGVTVEAGDLAICLTDGTASGDQATVGVHWNTIQVNGAYQPSDAELTALAGLTSAADKLPYFTGSGTAALADFTAAGRALVDDADAAAQRATMGVVIGTHVQAFDADLAAIAGLTSAANKGIMFTGAGTAGTYDLSAAALTILDDASVGAICATLGLGTGNSPQFAGATLSATNPALAMVASGAYSSIAMSNSGGATKTGTWVQNSGGEMSFYSETHAWTDYTGGTVKMALSGTQLGVYTGASPIIVASGGGNPQIRTVSTDGNVIAKLQCVSATAGRTGVIGMESNDSFGFYTNNSPRITVYAAGDLGIGTTTAPSANGGKVLIFGDNTNQPTLAAACVYRKSGELYTADASGNETLQTPHPEDMADAHDALMDSLGLPRVSVPWGYLSNQPYVGVRVAVDEASAMRLLEVLASAHFGRPITLIHESQLDGEPWDWDAVQQDAANQRAAEIAIYEAQKAEYDKWSRRVAEYDAILFDWEHRTETGGIGRLFEPRPKPPTDSKPILIDQPAEYVKQPMSERMQRMLRD